MQPISVRQATLDDLSTVSNILSEAALWLKQQNMALWGEKEIAPAGISQDVELGLFYIDFYENVAAGVVKLPFCNELNRSASELQSSSSEQQDSSSEGKCSRPESSCLSTKIQRLSFEGDCSSSEVRTSSSEGDFCEKLR
jgi:hypothetical protein